MASSSSPSRLPRPKPIASLAALHLATEKSEAVGQLIHQCNRRFAGQQAIQIELFQHPRTVDKVGLALGGQADAAGRALHQPHAEPTLDAGREGGMAVSVGRLRRCPLFDYKFMALGHNTIRGAAGVAILNAELLHAEGRL